MQGLLGLLGMGGGGLAVKDAYDRLGDIGDHAYSEAQRLGGEFADSAQFTGYGVTGPVGQANVDAQGNYNMDLSPTQQGMMDQWGGASMDFLGQATGPRDQREADIYESLRSMQRPGEQRDALALEERLAAQGRTGVQTNQYGGTPEQLAMAKAQAEARNTAGYQAMQQSNAEQMQNANLSQMFGQLQYAPQSALMDLFNTGSQGYQFADANRRGAAQGLLEAQMGGLDAMYGSRLGQANLMGHLGSSLLGGGMGMFSSGIASGQTGSTVRGILDSIKSIWK